MTQFYFPRTHAVRAVFQPAIGRAARAKSRVAAVRAEEHSQRASTYALEKTRAQRSPSQTIRAEVPDPAPHHALAVPMALVVLGTIGAVTSIVPWPFGVSLQIGAVVWHWSPAQGELFFARALTATLVVDGAMALSVLPDVARAATWALLGGVTFAGRSFSLRLLNQADDPLDAIDSSHRHARPLHVAMQLNPALRDCISALEEQLRDPACPLLDYFGFPRESFSVVDILQTTRVKILPAASGYALYEATTDVVGIPPLPAAPAIAAMQTVWHELLHALHFYSLCRGMTYERVRWSVAQFQHHVIDCAADDAQEGVGYHRVLRYLRTAHASTSVPDTVRLDAALLLWTVVDSVVTASERTEAIASYCEAGHSRHDRLVRPLQYWSAYLPLRIAGRLGNNPLLIKRGYWDRRLVLDTLRRDLFEGLLA